MVLAILVCAFYRVDKMYPSIMKELQEREARDEM